MSSKDAVVLASRVISVVFIIWGLGEVSYLPEFVNTYLHYNVGVTTTYVEYMQHYYLLRLSFLIIRIIGYFLVARWFYKVGPGVEELLLPPSEQVSLES